MKLDANARYQESHEWARQEGETIVCGITDHAQDSLLSGPDYENVVETEG